MIIVIPQVRSLVADPVSALASLAVEPMEVPDRKKLPEDAVVVSRWWWW